eukprot:scaffold181056_cov31-Tisochrysis_lutea.AAC.1
MASLLTMQKALNPSLRTNPRNSYGPVQTTVTPPALSRVAKGGAGGRKTLPPVCSAPDIGAQWEVPDLEKRKTMNAMLLAGK